MDYGRRVRRFQFLQGSGIRRPGNPSPRKAGLPSAARSASPLARASGSAPRKGAFPCDDRGRFAGSAVRHGSRETCPALSVPSGFRDWAWEPFSPESRAPVRCTTGFALSARQRKRTEERRFPCDDRGRFAGSEVGISELPLGARARPTPTRALPPTCAATLPAYLLAPTRARTARSQPTGPPTDGNLGVWTVPSRAVGATTQRNEAPFACEAGAPTSACEPWAGTRCSAHPPCR